MKAAERSRLVRMLFVAAGTLSLVLAILGVFLPLLPTTPFLLLASACYVRGSARLHRRLLEHPQLGPYIRNFEEGRGIPRRAKVITILLIWVSCAWSIYLLPQTGLKIMLTLIAAAVTIWLVRFPEVPDPKLR
jgi:uncharacterized membrane protein YbaN (DUF454 family)